MAAGVDATASGVACPCASLAVLSADVDPEAADSARPLVMARACLRAAAAAADALASANAATNWRCMSSFC